MTRQLKVALDVSAIPAKPAGAGRYIIDLVGALSQRNDLELTAIARRRQTYFRLGAMQQLNIKRAVPNSRPARLIWEQLAMARAVKSSKCQVLHSPHYTMPLFVDFPVVVTVHDLTFFDHPEWHERGKVLLFKRAIRAASRKAAAIICVSNFTATRLKELCNPEVPVHIIPHGVDHEKFKPEAGHNDDQTLNKLGVRSRYVLFVGTIEPRKDVPSLVRAFDEIASAHTDVELVIAGARGWATGTLDNTVAQSKYRNRIRMIGYVPDAALAPLLRGAAVVAYPSLEEGFGLPALESLACGTPLITTTGSAMEEVARDVAFLVEPGNSAELARTLALVLRGDPDLQRRVALGLERARSFTWERSAADHVVVYESVTGETRG